MNKLKQLNEGKIEKKCNEGKDFKNLTKKFIKIESIII